MRFECAREGVKRRDKEREMEKECDADLNN